jgi:hypothetical protein
MDIDVKRLQMLSPLIEKPIDRTSRIQNSIYMYRFCYAYEICQRKQARITVKTKYVLVLLICSCNSRATIRTASSSINIFDSQVASKLYQLRSMRALGKVKWEAGLRSNLRWSSIFPCPIIPQPGKQARPANSFNVRTPTFKPKTMTRHMHAI